MVKNYNILSLLIISLIFVCIPLEVVQASWFDSEDQSQSQSVEKYDKPFSFTTFRDIAKMRSNAVVNISTTTILKRQNNPYQFRSPFEELFGDDFFHFFQNPRQRQKIQSLGSGVIFDKAGYILTNNHVIEDVDEIQVTTLSGKTYDADIIGRDPQTDIGLIKIEPEENLTVIPLGDSDGLEVGDWVMAIGNPFGFGHTVTVGVVSAKGRSLVMPYDQLPYQDFIQTDASINPGNSGGPLLDINGRLIGVNTAIASRTGQSAGIGFSIPINLIKPLLDPLKKEGKVTRGWLGVTIQTLTDDLADSMNLDIKEGALVSEIVSDSPADTAGLEVGDVITQFNKKKIESSNQLSTTVASTPIGEKVEIHLIRKGKKKVLHVTLGERPDDLRSLPSYSNGEVDLGLSVQSITTDLARRFNLDNTQGVLISEVDPGGPADRAGLHSGDIILELNQTKIKSLSDFRDVVSKISEGESIVFYIQRGESKIFVALKTPEK